MAHNQLVGETYLSEVPSCPGCMELNPSSNHIARVSARSLCITSPSSSRRLDMSANRIDKVIEQPQASPS